MQSRNAQGDISQGVSFCIVEMGQVVHVGVVDPKEIEDDHKRIDRRQEVPKYNRPRIHWKEHHCGCHQDTQHHERYRVLLARPIEALEVYKKQHVRPISVHQKQTGREYKIYHADEIDLRHTPILAAQSPLFKHPHQKQTRPQPSRHATEPQPIIAIVHISDFWIDLYSVDFDD